MGPLPTAPEYKDYSPKEHSGVGSNAVLLAETCTVQEGSSTKPRWGSVGVSHKRYCVAKVDTDYFYGD